MYTKKPRIFSLLPAILAPLRQAIFLFSKKFFWVEENCWIKLKISAAGLRLINKVGLDAAVRQAIDKGYLNWNELEKNVLAWGDVEN